MKTLLPACLALFLVAQNLWPLAAQTTSPDNSGQAAAPTKTVFDLLARDSVLQLTIESDFGHLRRDKKLKKWQPATLRFTAADGQARSLSVEIKPGGVSRQVNCDWPPVKVRFPQAHLDSAGAGPNRSVELFLCCQEADRYRQYVVLEYAAYRLYAMLTERSFRTQLARVRLYDTQKGCVEMADFAFLLEHPDDFAARTGCRRLKPKVMAPTVVQEDAFDLVSLFEFMIGNTDWYPTNRHNIEFFAAPGLDRPLPVPYDFDYSGMVDAPYAMPHHAVPVENVTERYYQGLCREKGEHQKTIQLFTDHKEEMLAFCRAFPQFTDGTRRSTVRYLESFFDIIESPKKTERLILRSCGEWFSAPKD